MLEPYHVSVWCHLLQLQNLEFRADECFKMVSKTVQKAQISRLLPANVLHQSLTNTLFFLTFVISKLLGTIQLFFGSSIKCDGNPF